MPTAITAIGAAWRPMLSRLEAVRNPSSERMTANSPKISTAAMYTTYWRSPASWRRRASHWWAPGSIRPAAAESSVMPSSLS